MPAIRSQFLALLALAGIALLVERLIVTDAEAIRALADTAAQAAQAGDFERLEGLLTPSFRHGKRDRAGTLAHVRSLLNRHKPTGIEVSLFDVKVANSRATASALVSAQVYGRPLQARVDLVFEEGEDGWLLASAKGGGYAR